MTAAIHHEILPGAIGRITELHATHYNALAGFGVFFAAKVAREVADFRPALCRHPGRSLARDPQRSDRGRRCH